MPEFSGRSWRGVSVSALGLAAQQLQLNRQILEETMSRRRFNKLVAGVLMCAGMTGLASAQDGAPNTIVVGFAAGGSVDGAARILAEQLRQITGENYIVENRTGAAGRLAVRHTQNANPDGRTLMLVPHGPMALFPHIFSNLGFNPATDFTPISRVATLDYALVAGNDVPVATGEDLKKWAGENPEQASFGTPGLGTIPHFVGEIIGSRLGVKLTSVPYKGSALTVNDVVAGVVPLGVMPMADAVTMANAGRMKVVGTSGKERSPLTPNYPTLNEVGIDYTLDGWYAVYGPAGMDPEAVKRLNAAIQEALQKPELIERFAAIGLKAAGSTPEELNRIREEETAMWRAAVDQTGFKPLD